MATFDIVFFIVLYLLLGMLMFHLFTLTNIKISDRRWIRVIIRLVIVLLWPIGYVFVLLPISIWMVLKKLFE